MKRNLTFAVAILLVLGAGLVHGFWSERWYSSGVLDAAAARVPEVPLTVGDWVGEDVPADAHVFALAGARTYWMRTYTNKRTRASVLVILMCGRPGRMAVHTPEVCYQGAGFEMTDRPLPLSIATSQGQQLGTFWTARFAKANSKKDTHLAWAWNPGDTWHAPDSPRWQFYNASFLYKLYIVQEGSVSTAGAKEFLQRLLPPLDAALFDKAA
jgi:hypothetical protein